MIVAAALLQAVAGPSLPPPKRPRSDAPCPVATDPGDVVVCGRDNSDAFRLKPLPPRADEPALPRAEIGVGHARLSAEAEQVTLAGGAQSQRLMLRLKLPIGRKRAAQ